LRIAKAKSLKASFLLRFLSGAAFAMFSVEDRGHGMCDDAGDADLDL